MSNFVIKHLKVEDFNKGYVDLLSQLSSIDKDLILENQFKIFIDELPSNHFIFVINDIEKNKVIGSGTIIIERKIIHNFKNVGHIEDIVVDNNYRGAGLGKMIINYLLDFAEKNNCYKTILTCSNENIGFYEKFGFTKKDNFMARYIK